MEYKGFGIHVRRDCVVLGEDPMGPTSEGFVAEVRKPDPVQGDSDGRVIWDYPFGLSASLMEGATEDEVVAKAKAFIDSGGKPNRPSVGPREED
jgi:hypothetical protein